MAARERSGVALHGLPRPQHRPHPFLGDLEAAVAAVQAGASRPVACAVGHVSDDRLRRRLAELGITTRSQAPRTSKYAQLNDAQWLVAKLRDRVPLKTIAREVGCDRQTLRKALRRHGLALRP